MIKRGLFILTFILILCMFPAGALAAERYEIIKIGDQDEYVTQLQNKLAVLGYFEAGSTGYFGTVTQQAVIDYQNANDLVVDGKAGPETLASIMGDGFTISSDRFVENDDVNADTFYPGDKGGEISKIQQRLKDLQYYDYLSITGYYGPVTTKAIERFQRTNDLGQDGVAGSITLALLYSSDARFFCLYPGDRGSDVESLQTRLQELGFYTYGRITGYFGSVTESALIAFQKQNGLTGDGKAGKNTRAVLYSDDAIIFDGQDSLETPDDSTQGEHASSVDKMLSFAGEQLGKKYVYSTEGPSTFDCSGFVYYVLKYTGVPVRRYSADGFSKVLSWDKIASKSDLKPGDLLFFKSDTSTHIGHTGIYIGDNKFIHASSSGGQVKISTMTSYYERNFVFARRVF